MKKIGPLFLMIFTLVIVTISAYFILDKVISPENHEERIKEGTVLSGEELVDLHDGNHNELLGSLLRKGIYIVNDIELEGEAYNEEIKNMDSDIDGVSVYDKIQKGLCADDNSDTDGDGLTDKEEIEIYKSNPLMASTSGDLYRDSYKIENGMDINTFYEYNDDLVFFQNECSYVSLLLTDANDICAYVSEVSCNEDDLGFLAYRGVKIANYQGKVRVDISDILSSKGILADDILVYARFAGTDYYECEYNVEGSEIVVEKETDRNVLQFFYITDKDNKPKRSLYDVGETGINIILKDTFTEPYGLAAYSTVGCMLGGQPKVYIVDTGSEEMNARVIDKFKRAIDYQLSPYIVDYAFDVYAEEDVFVYATREEIDRKRDFLNSIPLFVEITDPDVNHVDLSLASFMQEIYSYYTYDTICKMIYEGEESYDIRDHKTFNLVEDTLPFENFGTKYHASGMCAGIAYLTTEAYNTDQIISKGSAGFGAFKIGELYYDLTTDEDNATLLDYGLNDYKTSSWVKEHTQTVADGTSGEQMRVIDEESLTDGEQQFVNYIACRWGQVNQLILAKTHYKEPGDPNYSYANIERLKKELDNNRIFVANLNIAVPISKVAKKAAGHSINIYGYEEYDDYDYLLVYDNNYPNKEGLKITITPFYDNQGNKVYNFEYKTPNYKFTSTDTPLYNFSIIDENFDFIQK